MVLLYLIAAGMLVWFAWFIFTSVRYLIKGSPEQQREEAAYRQLMDQFTEGASYYTGRPVSEEEILAKGREFNRSRKRFNKRHRQGSRYINLIFK